jgi:HPt (histidine-containing phosphotransfer) domain-containing protein
MNAQITAAAPGLPERIAHDLVEAAVGLIDAPEELPADEGENEHAAATIEVLGVPSSSLTPIDVAALRARCLNNQDLVGRVLAKFRATGLADLEQIEAATEQADFQTIARISHRFKGAAANVSAGRLHLMATYLEQLARDRNVPELQEAIAQTRGEWDVFAIFASSLLPRNSAAPKLQSGRPK